jgi:hypothetical protein
VIIELRLVVETPFVSCQVKDAVTVAPVMTKPGVAVTAGQLNVPATGDPAVTAGLFGGGQAIVAALATPAATKTPNIRKFSFIRY